MTNNKQTFYLKIQEVEHGHPTPSMILNTRGMPKEYTARLLKRGNERFSFTMQQSFPDTVIYVRRSLRSIAIIAIPVLAQCLNMHPQCFSRAGFLISKQLRAKFNDKRSLKRCTEIIKIRNSEPEISKHKMLMMEIVHHESFLVNFSGLIILMSTIFSVR